MGVPSGLPLPAAAGGWAGRPCCRPWGRMLLWTALLVLAPAASAAGTPSPHDPPKAVVRLEPPWFNVFLGDNVTLHCQGPHGPEDGPTQWSLDGTPIPTQVQPRFSFKASFNNSGNYSCQTGQTSLSDPVHLNVTSDYLLLQTPRLLLREGDPLMLRCHHWQKWSLFKISFFQDGLSKSFSLTNSSFFIPHANVSHSGRYHCTGFLGNARHQSQPVNITVQADSQDDNPFPVTITVALVVGIAAVAAVAAVAAWVCLRQRQSSANLTQTEEDAKTEAENTITYSLLMHPEEDVGFSDYQNI